MNDGRLFVWDVELDIVQTFDFSTGRNDEGIESQEVASRYPNIQYWDPSEPKLLVCQAVLAPASRQLDVQQLDAKDSGNTETLVSFLTRCDAIFNPRVVSH